MSMPISHLPNEILAIIFTYYILASYPAQTLQLVCRRWYAVAKETPVIKGRILFLAQNLSKSPNLYTEFRARCASPMGTVHAIERLNGRTFEFTYVSLAITRSTIEDEPLTLESSPGFELWTTFSRQCTKLHLDLRCNKARWVHLFPPFYALTHLEIINPANGVTSTMLARIDRGCPLISLKVMQLRTTTIIKFGSILGQLKRLYVSTRIQKLFGKLLPLLGNVEELSLRIPPILRRRVPLTAFYVPKNTILPNLTTLEAPGSLVGLLPPFVLKRITRLTVLRPSIMSLNSGHNEAENPPLLLPCLVHLTLCGVWEDLLSIDAPNLHQLVLESNSKVNEYQSKYALTRLRPSILRMTYLSSFCTVLSVVEDSEDSISPFKHVQELHIESFFSSGVDKDLIPALAKPILPQLKHLVITTPMNNEDVIKSWMSKMRMVADRRAEMGMQPLITTRFNVRDEKIF